MPYDLSADDINAFHLALGRFVHEWAGVEFCMDLIVLRLCRREKKLPHQLDAKLKAIRRKLVSVNYPQANGLLELLGEIETLAETRHDYVHGIPISPMRSRTGLAVKMARLLQPAKRPRRKPVRATVAQMEKFADRLHEIGDRLLDHAEIINSRASD